MNEIEKMEQRAREEQNEEVREQAKAAIRLRARLPEIAREAYERGRADAEDPENE